MRGHACLSLVITVQNFASKRVNRGIIHRAAFSQSVSEPRKIQNMPTLVDLISNFNIQNNVNVTIPTFRDKAGLWQHISKCKIVAIHTFGDLKENPKLDYTPVVGACEIGSSNQNVESYVFPDAIKKYGEEFSDYKSIRIVGGKRSSNSTSTAIIDGKRVDLRDTCGEALTAKSTGLFKEEACVRIELVCKIHIILYDFIQSYYGKWKSIFYSPDNSSLIESFAIQLTRNILAEDRDLTECYNWLNKEKISHMAYSIDQPFAFIKNMPMTDQKEWKTIMDLDLFINYFPLDLKNVHEPWSAFFDRCKVGIQDDLIENVGKHQKGWTTIRDYLTPENQYNHRGAISGEIYGT